MVISKRERDHRNDKRRGFVHNMKPKAKSAAKRNKPFAILLFFLLVGCADTKWPTWISGEPGDDVLLAPRAVARPTPSADKAWPNLGDVPSQKPMFSESLDLQDAAELLRSDQLKAQAEQERIQNVAMPESMQTIESTKKEKTQTLGTIESKTETKAIQNESLEPESPSEQTQPFFALRP